MEIILTTLAKKRMFERGVNLEHIKDTINFPDYTIRKNDKIEAYKKIKDKNLKVVYISMHKFIKIITLVWK